MIGLKLYICYLLNILAVPHLKMVAERAVKKIAEKDDIEAGGSYGISESDDEKLENKVVEVLVEINEQPGLRDYPISY